VLLILNISFLDGQHRRDVVEADTDPKRELGFAWLIVPGISKFPQRTSGSLEITGTVPNYN
jgi:hypothetical protein